jgi:hypothetical protein
MDHKEAERQVYLTTRAYLLANGDRDNAVDQLTDEGLSRMAAGLRADLVPMAFGWGLLKKMGVMRFPSEFNLSDTGEKVKVSDSHVFTTALGFALEVFENGYTEIFSKRVVEMLVSHSPEVDALNKALNAEPELELTEVSLSSSLVGYSAEEYAANA